VRDGEEKLYPQQRSGGGVFTSFYLEIKANSLEDDKNK